MSTRLPFVFHQPSYVRNDVRFSLVSHIFVKDFCAVRMPFCISDPMTMTCGLHEHQLCLHPSSPELFWSSIPKTLANFSSGAYVPSQRFPPVCLVRIIACSLYYIDFINPEDPEDTSFNPHPTNYPTVELEYPNTDARERFAAVVRDVAAGTDRTL